MRVRRLLFLGSFIAWLISLLPFMRAEQLELRPANGAALVSPSGSAASRPSAELQLSPGLSATLWADESLVTNPVAISFDAHGRLYVAETHRYRTSALDVRDHPALIERDTELRSMDAQHQLLRAAFAAQVDQLAVESERVRRIEDANRDGRADTTRIVADGFHDAFDGMVGGILAGRDELLLTVSPHVWKIPMKETPSEDKAGPSSQRIPLVGGLGIHIGIPQHGAGGVVLGPDGKVYFSVGDRGFESVGPEVAIDAHESGAVLRCYPDGSKLEVVATGLLNPHDLVFDDCGNLFAIDGRSGKGDRDRLVQVIDGSDSGWRSSYQSSPEGGRNEWIDASLWKPQFAHQNASILPPVAIIQDGATGLTYEPGLALAPSFRNAFFISYVGAASDDAGVQSYRLQPKGAGWIVRDSRPVLRGAAPTDVVFGPDQRLYFSDVVSIEQSPKSGRGRIYAVAAESASTEDKKRGEETRRLLDSGVENRTADELAPLLDHADQRVRLAAQFALAQRGGASLPLFQAVAENRTAARRARIHALWGAGQLAERVAEALNFVPPLLRDEDPEIRAQAARLLGEYGRFESYRFLIAALNDPEPRVISCAVQSLGKLRRPEAVPALLEVLRRNDDQDVVLRHIVVIALARLSPDPALAKSIRDPSRAVRLGGLLAYRKLGDAAVADFLSDFEADIVREAARAINDAPVEAALPQLAAVLEQAPLDDVALVLRAINAHFRLGGAENARALGAFASKRYVPASLRAEALIRLGEWTTPPGHDSVTGRQRALATREPEPARQALTDFLGQQTGQAPELVQVATINAVAVLKVPGTGHALWDVVYQNVHPVSARIAALHALEQLHDARFEVAVQHAARSESAALRLATIPMLARFELPIALPILKGLLARGGVAEQQAIFPLLARFSNAGADELLAQALRRWQSGELRQEAQSELLEAATRRKAAPVVAAELEKLPQAARLSGKPDTPPGGSPKS